MNTDTRFEIISCCFVSYTINVKFHSFKWVLYFQKLENKVNYIRNFLRISITTVFKILSMHHLLSLTNTKSTVLTHLLLFGNSY